MDSTGSLPVVFLPGGVTPVGPSYAPLLDELGSEITPVLRDLEVYAADAPPADYSMESEIAALVRDVDAAGLATFHLVGYSGGGAVCLTFAARYPDRLRSLAIFEPANAPGPWVPDDHPEFSAGAERLPPDEMLREFTRRQLRPGVEPPPPPPGPTPEWMATRPAGLRALMRAFQTDTTDPAALRACAFPAYVAYGLLTGESMVRRVQFLAGLLPDIWIEAYAGIHHFAPPQRSLPARYAKALRQLWSRAEGGTSSPGLNTDPGYAA
jgi:pimeloyl-ACP methyl ester carboxylesterase